MSGEQRARVARNVIVAVMERRQDPTVDLASEAAQALEDAGLLQSPERAAELARLRAGVAEVAESLRTILASPEGGEGR
ncbi:hypothetical protein [Streptomyces sp. NPDC053079]|uniref:hypothetical protein n=1 Tax=Streptomyces sp. NPDC053079 TaxID=3365697 RepID=UPI0037D62833